MESQSQDVMGVQSSITNQKSPIAKGSTGPRTGAGKRRSSQNAYKHGLYSNAGFFCDAAIALGEDPREFERLLKGLMLARQPADALEMVLVEDIALLVWKKARLDRAEAAVQVCNLHKHDLERRKHIIQVGREITDTLESEVREKGLRRTLDAPGKFEQVLSFLQSLMEMVEKNEFSYSMQEALRALYGTDPTLRGAGLYNFYFKLSKMKPSDKDFEDAKTSMTARLAEEIADVGREYELFLHEHVESTRAARVAATAPSHAQWAAIIRQQNALHRHLEHKIRLLEEMQEKRKKKEERFPDKPGTSLPRSPSHGPRGGRQGVTHTSRSSKSAGSPRRRRGVRSRSLRSCCLEPRMPTASPDRRDCARRDEPLRAADRQRTHGCATGALRRNPSHRPCDSRHTSNLKKILNRGNELGNLLRAMELIQTTMSKRTHFCVEKVAMRAKKVAFQPRDGGVICVVFPFQAPSERCAVQGNDELNTCHVYRVEAGIVGDEEVDSGGCGAGQLNRIRGSKRAVRTQRCVDSCRLHVEGKHDRGCGDSFLVFPGKFLIPPLEGLDEDLAQSECGGQQLIASLEHRPSQIPHALGEHASPFKQVYEQVGVPEDAAHSQPLRSRRTYSSACSSAHSRRPEPSRERSRSTRGPARAAPEDQSRYQVKRP